MFTVRLPHILGFLLLVTGLCDAQTSSQRAIEPLLQFDVPVRHESRPYGNSAELANTALRTPRIGLVLSGGAARGVAQVGVLRALEEANIRPDFIAGTSIGSIIGGLYAGGYDANRLQNSVNAVDWSHVLQLSDEADRSALVVDQKPVSDRSILTVRFDGLLPVLPQAVSNGQRLTNMLNELALQGYYQSTNFDSLGIPFRAVATDLVSGERVIIGSGSLAEAMRSSSTIPVMYAAVPRDSMLLVDGGLVSNLPVDVALAHGCDLVIAINTSSPLSQRWEIRDPFETLDQVFSVMMKDNLERQRSLADFVIEPILHDYSGNDFDKADSLIEIGYRMGKQWVQAIRDSIDARMLRSLPRPDDDVRRLYRVQISGLNDDVNPEIGKKQTLDDAYRLAVALQRRENIRRVNVAIFADSLVLLQADSCSRITAVHIHGNTLLSDRDVAGIEARWRNACCNADNRRGLAEYILHDYRRMGYSLARIDSMRMSEGDVHVHLNEGHIDRILVHGNEKTDRVVILRELQLPEGEVFQISALRRWMANLASLNLFHYVTFDIEQSDRETTLILRVIERPSQMLQTAILVDDERNAQLGVVIRDANFFGTGTELAASFFSGDKNRQYVLRYSTNKLFYTPFSLSLMGYYGFKDYNNYREVTGLPDHRFEREVSSIYRIIKTGALASFGLYVQRFGSLLGTIRYEHQRLRTDQVLRTDPEMIDEENHIVALSLSSTIDTKDRYPYPRTGIFFTAEYTSAQTSFGSEIPFSRLFSTYELFIPAFGQNLIVHPRFVFGYGDKTMPQGEEFRIGGLHSFIGMRENEFNGRQIAVGSIALRYHMPFSILFDTYLSLRYDIGRTWKNPELVRIEDLRHGAGLIVGLDTPIGPADFAIGKSFYFLRNKPTNPVRWGPTNLYFSIGVELN